MVIDNKIKDEKLQYNINTKETKISALSSGFMAIYECLVGKEILPFSQRQMIEKK